MKSYDMKAGAEHLDEMATDITMVMQGKGFWNLPRGMTPEDEGRIALMKKMEKNALLTSEVSEHLEAIRKKQAQQSEHIPGFTAEEEEIADILIRALDYAGHYKMRIGEAIAAKMAFNEGRPFMHGKTA